MPRPLDVFSRPMNEVAGKAEKFAITVAGEHEDFESHYRDNRKRVVAYAWEIAYIVEKNNDRVAYKFASACLRANRTRTARGILESLALSENGTSKYVASAKRRLARLAWKAGDLETAARALRSVRGRAARTQYRTWLGLLTVRNGLLLGESGDAESARAVLTGGLLASGMHHAIAEGVAAIYLKAACRAPLDTLHTAMPADDLAERSSRHGPIPIILSGFGWSGSGAVADFLKGYPQVADIFSGREMGLWTGKYGLDRLYAHFASRGFNRRLLLEFLTRHCFGHSFLGDNKRTKSLGGMWHWLGEPQRWMLLDALGKWLESIEEWQKNPAHSLLEAFQGLSSRLLRLLTGEETLFVLLSNCIPSDAIAGIRMFEAPAVIVSWRDPGDAYASKMAAFPDTALEFDGWKVQLMARINRYLAGKREVAEYARLWMDVSFEEFVQDDRLRQQLSALLNLDGQPMESTFDPAISARNIGILQPVAGKNRSAWSDLASAVREARAEAQVISRQTIGEGELPLSGAMSREHFHQ
jgi:hypothetical protein